MPGVGAISGDLVVISIVFSDTIVAVTTPAGWTLRGSPSTASTQGKIFTRTISSTTTSLTISTSGPCKSAYTVTLFRGGDTWGGISSTGSAASASPSYGTLLGSPETNETYIAVAMWDGSVTLSAYPTDFPSGQETENNTGYNIASAVSNVRSTLPTAKTFTLSGSALWSSVGMFVNTPSGGPAPVIATLESGTLTLDGGDLTPSDVFLSLGSGTLTLDGAAMTPYLLAVLESGTLELTTDETLLEIYDPTFVNDGTLQLVGGDLNWLIATNADLDSGTLTLSPSDVTNDLTFNLESGTLTLSGETHLGCARLIKNRILKLDFGTWIWDICLLAPEGTLTENDFYGAVLVGASTNSRTVKYDFTPVNTTAELTAKGDLVIFRELDGEVYRWRYEG